MEIIKRMEITEKKLKESEEHLKLLDAKVEDIK